MMKSIILLCFYGALLTVALPTLDTGGNHQNEYIQQVRRQMPTPEVMMGGGIPNGMSGSSNSRNLAMQALGNIPDPTAWIAKGQEIASQLARGRRDTSNLLFYYNNKTN